MRMSRQVRDTLEKAAKRDHRTIASLLDKIIADYLEADYPEKEGIPVGSQSSEERRIFERKKLSQAAEIYFKEVSETKAISGEVLDISLGGVLIAYPKESKVQFIVGAMPKFDLCLGLPQRDETISFECEARRISDSGDEIHVGAIYNNPNYNNLKLLKSYLN
jgi:hypothetical protein